MNKKLLAAALGVAFAAPVFADASNLTLYGRLHTVLDHQSTDTGAASTGGNFTVQSASSRVGIKGQEDLGSGLNLVFGWEVQISSDANDAGNGVTGNSGALNDGRHAYLGFKGAYGTLTVGTQDGGNETVAPFYDLASTFAGGLTNNGGPLTQVQSDISSDDSVLAGNQRRNNSFGYSHTIAGVKIAARHSLNGTNNASNNAGATTKENGNRETEVSAAYTIGDLMIGGALFLDDRQGGTPAAANVENGYLLGATYKMGALKLGAGVQVNEYYGQVNGDDSETRAAISATYDLGGGSQVYGLFGDGEDLDGGNDLQQFQLVYSYDLSKRTRTYVGFQRVSSDPIAGGAETDVDNFTVGLRHNF
ncbi:MAG: porin [Limnobacter sp.]|nr:porin [Limnobacter sp.]